MLMSAALPQGLTPHMDVIYKIYILGGVEQLRQHNSIKGKEFLSINAT